MNFTAFFMHCRLCKEVDKQLREGRDEIDSLPRLTSAFKMEHDCKAEVDIPLVTIWDSLLSLNAVDLNKSPSNECKLIIAQYFF